jgi:hypothetical protein
MVMVGSGVRACGGRPSGEGEAKRRRGGGGVISGRKGAKTECTL